MQTTIITQNYQKKTKLSPLGLQWSRHSVARVRLRGGCPPSQVKCNVMVYLANVGRQGILVSYQWKI
jgi:hypothetical protein